MATVLERMQEMEISIKMIADMRKAMESSGGGTGLRLFKVRVSVLGGVGFSQAIALTWMDHVLDFPRQFLGLFWVDEFGFGEKEVPCEMFCAKLVEIVVKDDG